MKLLKASTLLWLVTLRYSVLRNKFRSTVTFLSESGFSGLLDFQDATVYTCTDDSKQHFVTTCLAADRFGFLFGKRNPWKGS